MGGCALTGAVLLPFLLCLMTTPAASPHRQSWEYQEGGSRRGGNRHRSERARDRESRPGHPGQIPTLPETEKGPQPLSSHSADDLASPPLSPVSLGPRLSTLSSPQPASPCFLLSYPCQVRLVKFCTFCNIIKQGWGGFSGQERGRTLSKAGVGIPGGGFPKAHAPPTCSHEGAPSF